MVYFFVNFQIIVIAEGHQGRNSRQELAQAVEEFCLLVLLSLLSDTTEDQLPRGSTSQ